MTFLVPFDGTPLSRAALDRADTYGDAPTEDVLAVSVVPDDDIYAREKDWIDGDEQFHIEAVAGRLREMVADVSDDAGFEWHPVDDASAETITDTLRDAAGEHTPSVVFLGSENAGQIVTPLSSVGGGVASDAAYDVHLVRHWSPVASQ